MNNNLRRLEKDLRSYAKRCKDVKYTSGLLLTFLLTGMLSLATTSVTNRSIEQQRQSINNSISDMKQSFRRAKRENNKLLKNANLELIQLMEQGDQVVKSSWSSWQFGANYYYNSWNGVYKGRGDKAEKYPYEGLFTRSKDPFERYISTESEMYSLLSTSTDSTSASSNARRGLSSNYGIASTTPVVEPIVSFNVSVAINPRKVDKSPVNINLPSVSAPNAPSINVTATTPLAVGIPSVTAPGLNPSIPEPNTSPFNDYSFQASRVYTNSSNSSAQLPEAASKSGDSYVYWSGWNPNTSSFERSSGKGTVSTLSSTNRASSVIYLNDKRNFNPLLNNTTVDETNKVVGGFNFGGTSTEKLKMYIAGNVSGTPAGQADSKNGTIGFHMVWNGTLHDVEGYLKGRSTLFSIETWHSPKIVFENINVDIEGNENTIFYIYPSGYDGVVRYTGDYNSWRQRGAFLGTVNANIKSKGNAVYSIMGVSGSFNITSEGTYKLEGANNLIYSGLGYSPNFQNLIGFGSYVDSRGTTRNAITDAFNTGMTPILNLKTSPESYGDGNVILFFSDLLPDGTQGYQTTSIYNSNYTTWKKSKIGIYQGEVRASARIGEQLAIDSTANSQTSNGNNTGGNSLYVEDNVGILARSGQRSGIVPSRDLGASEYTYVDNDAVHALYVNDIDVTFGKYSKGNIMIASERGTQVDVAMSSNSSTPSKGGVAIRTTPILDYRISSSTDLNNNSRIDSTDDTTNEAAIGTIIALAKGKWSDSTMRMSDMSSATSSVLGTLQSQINIGQDVVMSSKYSEIGGVKYYPIAYAADGGVINAKSADAKGFGSVMAFSRNSGTVNVDGNITAVDEWATNASASSKYKNIGAYATGIGSTIVVKGNAIINGMGAFADNGAIITIGGLGSNINAGESIGIAATNGGIINFGGGTITVGTGSLDDTKSFYADSSSKINFTGATTINITKGDLIVGDASDYGAAMGTSTIYNGMSNVDINISGTGRLIKTSIGETGVIWNGGSLLVGNIGSDMKLNSLNVVGTNNVKAYYINGDYTINSDVKLGETTDLFNSIFMTRELVTINSGINVSSVNGTGLAMASNTTATNNSQSGYINNGTINITGGSTSKAATNVNYGTIINNGTITLDNGVAIYGANGSKLENKSTGKIDVTGSGQGIVGMATGTTTQSYGTDAGASGKSVDIVNDGQINISGIGGTAIYADNNTNTSQGNITVLNTNKLTLGDNGVGIGVKGINGGIITVTGTGSSDIVTGVSGVGIYAENSTLNLNTDYGIETKDGGVGIFSSGTTISTINPLGTTLEYKYSGSSSGTGIGIVYSGSGVTNNTHVKLLNNTATTGGIIGIYTNGGGLFTNNGKITGNSSALEFGIVSDNGTNVTNNANIILSDATSISDANVGIYSKVSNTTENNGNVVVGNNSIGIYGYSVDNKKDITAGNNSTAIYSQGGNVTLSGGTITVGGNEAVGVYTLGSGQNIINSGTSINIGNTSYGFVNVGTGNSITSSLTNNTLGSESVYIYSSDLTGTVTNSTNLISTGSQNYGIYSAGTVNNSGNMDLSSGVGNVGIYSVSGGTATNTATISIGASDIDNEFFGIGMAAGFKGDLNSKPAKQSFSGNIINSGIINVNGKSSIGMYATESGSTVTNIGTINLNADNTTGIFLDNGAKGYNHGTITTGAPGLNNVVGVYVSNGAELENHGSIIINATNGIGTYFKGGTVANYGTINVTGAGAQNNYTFQVADTSKDIGGVDIDTTSGSAVITRDGVQVTPVSIVTNLTEAPKVVSISSIGYVC